MNTAASPKISGATSRAPHICDSADRKIAVSCRRDGRRYALMSSHAVRVAVPATNGAHENVTTTGAFNDPWAATLSFSGT